jgi:hypothetical protein
MRRSAVVVAVLFVLAGLGQIAPASASGAGGGKGAKAAPTRPSAAECTLRPSAHLSARSEWASCLGVDATLSRAPRVGETAQLTVRVSASAPRATRISIQLPSNLAFVGTPSGMRVAAGRSFADATQQVSEASATRTIAKGSTVAYRATVKAVAPGKATITARALANVSAGRTDGGSDSVFLSIGRTSSSLHPAYSTRAGTARVPAGTRIRPASNRPYVRVPEDAAARPASQESAGFARAHPNFTVCASGFWSYQDQAAVWHPSMNIQVQAWDDNSISSDSLLATGVTGGDGSYNLCFDNAETGLFEGGFADVYVLFITSNSVWRVRDTPGGNNNYVWHTGTVADMAANHDFGSLTTGDPALHRALHAFDEVNTAWLVVQGMPAHNGCFDPYDGSCRQHVINWTPTSTDGTYYSPSGNDVHLAAADPDSQIQTDHELGHSVMDDVYDDNMPASPNCNPHSIPAAQSAGCGWVEGWATYFSDWVWNDPFYRWPDGGSLNEETPTWGTGGWANGDWPEGRTTGFLWDLRDATNESPYDRAFEGPNNIWWTFTHHNSTTLSSFWSDRSVDFDTSFNGPSAAALYQNTVDYGYRDPLGDYASLSRPTPPNQAPIPAGSSNTHRYVYNTTTNYWSAVAIRPSSLSDYDLALYDDYGMGSFLASSTAGTGGIDFIAVDSNRRAFGDYYPDVYVFGGSALPYQVELAQGSQQARKGDRVGPDVGTQTVSMGSSEVVAVRDTLQSAGVPVFVRLVPANGGQDGAIYLMESNPGDSSTWVRGRFSAVASSDSAGAGGSEAFSYNPLYTEFEGLVILNKSGSGNYSLYVDTTAPTGSVTINGGATYTRSTSVTLGLSAVDGDTGIDAMRISTDGAMDSEPFVPFAASAGATLPAGDGTKTVLVQYRNNAGMLSSVVSDTIVLDTTAPVITKAPAAKFKKGVKVGATVPIVVTWNGTDALSGIQSFSLEVSQDGGAFTPVATTPAKKVTTNVAPGHGYQFRVRATDVAGNVSGSTAGPAFTLTAYQETAGSVAYSSGWTSQALAGSYGGTVKYATQLGKTATFSFTGTQVAWISTQDSGRGTADVSLDGHAARSVDTNKPAQKTALIVYVKSSGSGAHSLLITLTAAARVDVDGFLVMS